MKKFPLLGKAMALGAVTVGLLVALEFVSSIVHEREGRLHEAEAAVADSLASQQTLVGPALQRRCEESWESVQGTGAEQRKVVEQRSFTLRQAPQRLQISGDATLEPRYRGLFKVNGFAAKTQLSATWPALTALGVPRPEHAGGKVGCEAPELFVAVSDVRGIRVATIQLASAPLTVLPGSRYEGEPAGFHAVLPEAALEADGLQAEVALELLGTGSLAMAPVGEATEVALRSDWPHPSFGGRFLPASRQISEQGFNAKWALSALATSAGARLVDGAPPCRLDQIPFTAPAATSVDAAARGACVETFGVHFIDPVNPYVMSDRATKYGLLFIVLTFVGVGLVEVMRSLRVHPIQYLLVGSALAMFFLLLVSLTEQIGFDLAYACASAACTLLLGFYGSFVLHGARAGALFGAAIAGVYGALYLLLRLEQSALVLGSVALFVVLAVVMAATRKIDWYALMQQMRGGDDTRPPALSTVNTS